MNKLGILKNKDVAFIIIDIQESLIPVIDSVDEIIKNTNILIKGAEVLGVPLLVTEQYPKGLGATHSSVELPAGQKIIEKSSFSCFGEEKFVKAIKDLGIKSVVICGIEAHVCVTQTVLDALNHNLDVYVVADAISSRKAVNKQIGIERMRQSGAFIVNTEMVLFQLLEVSGGEAFKAISKLVK
ncbi:MAG: hydrolase [Chloroflexia bacterium]|nr:hydrolase [Chloroflexia bacterium]